MLPVDLMVELLMANAVGRSRFRGSVSSSGKWEVVVGVGAVVTADDRDELRSKVRSHLQSLIPPPVLLSECEEGVATHCEFNPKKFKVLAKREGDYAVGAFGDVIGIASDFKVIQPVEVNREFDN